MSQEDRDKALDKALKEMDKRFGQGVVMRLGEQSALDVEVVPTGSLALDKALGIGGYLLLPDALHPQSDMKLRTGRGAVAAVESQSHATQTQSPQILF
jgi:recombination protein RecA